MMKRWLSCIAVCASLGAADKKPITIDDTVRFARGARGGAAVTWTADGSRFAYLEGRKLWISFRQTAAGDRPCRSGTRNLAASHARAVRLDQPASKVEPLIKQMADALEQADRKFEMFIYPQKAPA